MNFEDAYRKLREGTATDEEAAFVARELENVRRIGALLDDPALSDPGIRKAEAETVKKARTAFNRKMLVRTVVIVLVSLAVIAAAVCGVLFIPSNVSASGHVNVTREEALELARAELRNQVGEQAAADFYVDYQHRRLHYTENIFRAVYVYRIQFENARDVEYTFDVNASSGHVSIHDIDW